MLVGLVLGFIAGCLFAAWRFSVNSGAMLRQARRTAEVFTLGSTAVGPELQKLGRIHFGGRT